MRTVKRIIKIHTVEGFKVFVLFNNGESRVIDFNKVLDHWGVTRKDIEFPLRSEDVFQQVKLVNGTLVWENISLESTDEDGNVVTYPYEIDPITLYEHSEDDEERAINIGIMIKQSRKEMGLTQEQLASKIGTSKYYISRIENNKTGVELSTLVKIVEGGLGKRIQIRIV